MAVRLNLIHSRRKTKVTTAACALYSLLSTNLPIVSSAFASRGTNQSTISVSSISTAASSTATPFAFHNRSNRTFSSSALKMSSTIKSPTSTLTVTQVPCLDDNYGYLIHDPETGHTAAVDTPDASAYEKELKNRGWKLSHIFNTHHHWDHTGGNLELKEKNDQLKIYGPASETIPGIDGPLSGGDQVTSFGNDKTEIQIIDVGGHTNGHIAFYFPNDGILFSGDALFALGCGKMFEGTPSQFWSSLKRLRSLPDDTVVYCAHEYTQSNAKFAMSVEPGNAKLVSRVEEIMSKRQRGEPTVPSFLINEKETNPFLRVDVSEEIQQKVGATSNDSDDVIFGKVRKAKDNFRG